jgi:hypothetical protein
VYDDDLGDIKLETTITQVEESKKAKEKTKAKEAVNQLDEEESIIFDDLPDIGSENSNPFKKLANWARQLF